MASLYIVILDGLAFGMLLFIVSVGMSVTMGIMKVVNLAHGGFAMLGGYAGILSLQYGFPFSAALIMAAVTSGLTGFLLELLLYRRVYDKGELIQLLMTFGLTFVFVSVVSFIFGSSIKPLYLPPALSGTLDLGFREYPKYRLFIIVAGVLIAVFGWILINKSYYGLRVRAAIDNAEMASAIGINNNMLLTITFSGASALAGMGALIGAEMLPLEPYYAFRYIVLFLLVIAVGGEGSLLGSLLAALLIGLADTIGKFFLSGYSSYMIFLVIIVVLLIRPEGLISHKS